MDDKFEYLGFGVIVQYVLDTSNNGSLAKTIPDYRLVVLQLKKENENYSI